MAADAAPDGYTLQIEQICDAGDLVRRIRGYFIQRRERLNVPGVITPEEFPAVHSFLPVFAQKRGGGALVAAVVFLQPEPVL